MAASAILQLTDDARLEGFTGCQSLVAHPDGLDAQKQLQTAIPDFVLDRCKFKAPPCVSGESSFSNKNFGYERRQFSNLEIIWPVELRELGGATLTLQRVLARGSGDFTGLGAGRTGIAAVCTGANRREKGLRGQLVWTGVANDDRRLVSFEDSSLAEGCRT